MAETFLEYLELKEGGNWIFNKARNRFEDEDTGRMVERVDVTTPRSFTYTLYRYDGEPLKEVVVRSQNAFLWNLHKVPA